MKITIKNLKIRNFKAIRNLEITDFPEELSIRGANETGKSSIVDAFNWLFFGKNSEDKAEFNIKTIENGEALHKIDHEVEVLMDVDGVESTYKRVYREKWTKKRGEETKEHTGHETLYFVNEVPLSQSEYKVKVNSMISEDLFKLLTSPLYFNSLKWDRRREILFGLTEEIQDIDIAGSQPEFVKLIGMLGVNKRIDEYKRELASKRLKLKRSLDEIPSRVDEANRNMPEQPDIIAINKEIAAIEIHIAEVNEIIEDHASKYNSANESNLDIRTKIDAKKNTIQLKESQFKQSGIKSINEAQESRVKLTGEVQVLQRKIDNLKTPIQDKKNYITELEGKLTTLRADWVKLSAEEMPEFKEEEKVCPTCKRPLEIDTEAEKDKFKESWAKAKVDTLNTINENGSLKTTIIKEQKAEILVFEADLGKLTEEIVEKEKQRDAIVLTEPSEIKITTEQVAEIEKYQKEIQVLTGQIIQVTKPDNTTLIQKRSEYQLAIDAQRAMLAVQDTIENTKKRIAELLESEKSYAKQIADLEKMQFTVTRFEKAKVDAIEAKINKMFTHVRFRMFKKLINEGMEPCCDTLYKGVPFPDLNSAGKIWAGLDIINTLSDYNDVYAPIWNDNRESTSEIPEMKAQIINLYVDPSCRKLTFNN